MVKQERKKERSLNLATKVTGQRLFTIKTRCPSEGHWPLFLFFLFLTSNHQVRQISVRIPRHLYPRLGGDPNSNLRDVQCCLQVGDTYLRCPRIYATSKDSPGTSHHTLSYIPGHLVQSIPHATSLNSPGMSHRTLSCRVQRIPQGTSQDSPGMSHRTLSCIYSPEDPTRDIPGCPTIHLAAESGGSHTGHPRVVPGCPTVHLAVESGGSQMGHPKIILGLTATVLRIVHCNDR